MQWIIKKPQKHKCEKVIKEWNWWRQIVHKRVGTESNWIVPHTCLHDTDKQQFKKLQTKEVETVSYIECHVASGVFSKSYNYW